MRNRSAGFLCALICIAFIALSFGRNVMLGEFMKAVSVFFAMLAVRSMSR